jgi:hypothetical protein
MPAKFDELSLTHRASVSIAHVWHDSPTVALLMLSFGAYLIGMFFEAFDDLMIKLSIIAFAISALFIFPLLALIAVVMFPYIVAAPFLIVASICGVRARKYHTRIGDELAQWSQNAFVLARQYYNLCRNLLLRAWSPSKSVKDYLVASQIAKLLDAHPELDEKFCQTLGIQALRAACVAAGLESKRSPRYISDSEGKVIDVAHAASRSLIDSESENVVRRYLRDRMATSPELRRAIISSVLDSADIRTTVDSALSAAVTHIQADRPSVFGSYDRLQTESEFRRGIALPIGIVLVSVFDYYPHHLILVTAVAAIPAILIYFSGMRKQEEATKVVVDSIGAQITPIRIEVSDSMVLRWPVSKTAERQGVKFGGLLNGLFVVRKRITDARSRRISAKIRPRKLGRAMDPSGSVAPEATKPQTIAEEKD